MAVYVDDMAARYGRMVMFHMVADTTEELTAMATKIGVSAKHIQKRGTIHEHFDICLTKRALAVRAGAIEIDRHGLALFLRSKRAELELRAGAERVGRRAQEIGRRWGKSDLRWLETNVLDGMMNK